MVAAVGLELSTPIDSTHFIDSTKREICLIR